MNFEKLTPKDIDTYFEAHGAEETFQMILTMGRNCFVGSVYEWIETYNKYADLVNEERMKKGIKQ